MPPARLLGSPCSLLPAVLTVTLTSAENLAPLSDGHLWACGVSGVERLLGRQRGGPRSALTGGRDVWRSTCGKGGESRSVVIGKGRHSLGHRRSRSQREYEACHSESFGGRGTRQMILTDGGQQPGSRSGTRKDTEAGAAATKKKRRFRDQSLIF